MARSNPELVEELIDNIWTMPQWEFEEKYAELNSSDRGKVMSAINRMDKDMDREIKMNSLW